MARILLTRWQKSGLNLVVSFTLSVIIVALGEIPGTPFCRGTLTQHWGNSNQAAEGATGKELGVGGACSMSLYAHNSTMK